MDFEELPISEQLPYTTVRIECVTKDNFQSTGTGFLYNFTSERRKSKNGYVPCIVTNKHVFKNSKKGCIYLTEKNSDETPSISRFKKIEIDNFERRWFKHPNEQIDLAILPLYSFLPHFPKDKVPFFYRALSDQLIPSDSIIDSLSSIEEIITIGYPNGLWDSANNRPIVRKGTTATDVKLNYNGKEEFLIDAACFPGSSGSPVFVVKSESHFGQFGNFEYNNVRVHFLGILYSGPQISISGEIDFQPIPTSPLPKVVSKIMMNLGNVIKSSQMSGFYQIIEKF